MTTQKSWRLELILLVFSFCLLASCSNKTNTLFYVKTKTASNAPVQILQKGDGAVSEKLYQKILPGDLLTLRNLQNETQILGYRNSIGVSESADYLVEQDSTVTLPFLNNVKLGGLFISDAEKYLNKIYSNNLLKDPIIKIKITNLKVTTMGEFSRIANIPLLPNKTYLTDIIAESGGLNVRANPKKIRIIRGNLKNPEVILINLRDINSLASDKLFLRKNDIIYAETKKSYIFLDQISSTRNIIGIAVSAVSAYLLINTLTK